jgi:hypothetical protein
MGMDLQRTLATLTKAERNVDHNKGQEDEFMGSSLKGTLTPRAQQAD